MYPHCVMHAQEHNELVNQIKDMAKIYFVDKSKPLDVNSLKELNAFMTSWLTNHIKVFDVGMRDWVAK